ncbi:sulfotransferase family protein [Taklimakanibacter deserti]|uniref:sulfotransferase family protein n=1 Tax=Taklimakanibacter deserti TaxID=2267839 RepID=UPI000E656259
MPLEVIGPGFGRTGTNSLKIALEQLGFGPCHHMFEVRDNPERLVDWEALARGEKVDWDHVFRGYRSQVDWPGARYWRELVRHYPTAKVVLSVRDPDEWFDSVQATIVPFLAARGHHSSPHVNAICEMGHEMVAAQVFNGRISERQHATQAFKNHIADVQSEIPADRLLTFDLRDGWRPLCEFLRVEVPDIPFPKTNSSKEFVEQEWKQA